MRSISLFLFIVLHLLLGLLSPIIADDNSCDNDYGNFTSGSSYGVNRNKILSSLHTYPDAIQGFYGSLGTTFDDIVYVFSYCRGDSTVQQCMYCLNATAVSLIQACPNQKKSLSWGAADPPCTIRYSDKSMFRKLETDPELLLYNTGDITLNQTKFDKAWLKLTRGLAARAAKGSSQLKYASGESKLPNLETIFALMQCSPDLSKGFCKSCLLGSIKDYQGCCRGKRGGAVYKPSCIFRWDMYPFYNSSTPTSPPPPPPSPTALPPTNTTKGNGNTGGNDMSRSTIIVVVAVVVAVVSVGLAMCIVILMKKRKTRNPKQNFEVRSSR